MSRVYLNGWAIKCLRCVVCLTLLVSSPFAAHKRAAIVLRRVVIFVCACHRHAEHGTHTRARQTTLVRLSARPHSPHVCAVVVFMSLAICLQIYACALCACRTLRTDNPPVRWSGFSSRPLRHNTQTHTHAVQQQRALAHKR